MNCPNCGAGVSIRPNMRRFTCRKCGVQFPIPRANTPEPAALAPERPPDPAPAAPEPPAPEPPQPATPTPEKKRAYDAF